jgi:hypothetical protein
MEKNSNHTNNKSTSYKFNTSLLNRPFSSTNDQKEKDKSQIDNNFNISSSSFYSNNNEMNNSRLSSISGSISFTKKDLNDFNASMSNMNILNQSHQSNVSELYRGKRKPFENISFNKESQLHSFKDDFENKNEMKNLTNSQSMKGNEETQLTNKKNQTETLLDNPINNQISESVLNMDSVFNITHLTDKEKSIIKNQSKKLDKATLEKARLYNNQFSNSVPFWITFFEEIESDNLRSNSSYFKVDDKDKYISNLINLVKKDAELYDVMNNHKRVKAEVKNNIKNLLITEINPDKNDLSIQSDKNDVNVNTSNLTQSNRSQLSQSKLQPEDKEDAKFKEKLTELLMLYDKLDEKEKKLIKKTTNFEEQKVKMLSEGKISMTKEDWNNFYNKNISIIEERLVNCSKNIREELKEAQPMKLIDNINFSNNQNSCDDFEEIEYDAEFGAFQKSSIKKLLELDRKLNQMNPEKYTDSINTHLKKIQNDFIDNKPKRDREFEEKYKKDVEKFKTIKDKKTIFDIKEEDQKKIEYKNYLHEMKMKKEKEIFISNISKEREIINNQPVDEERRLAIIRDLEKYHLENENTEVYKQRIKNIKGCYDEEKVECQYKELEEREFLKKKLLISLEEKFKYTDEEMNLKFNELKQDDKIKEMYQDLMIDVDREYGENKKLLNRCEELEKYIEDAEETIDNIGKMKIY